ncbi:MAG: phosphopantothenoylcysteine decarboxylase [Phycisphaerales bacterium]
MRFLVTAGPTHEPIDAVRYLGNRSSGRMGVAIAEAAHARGCAVTLCLGPVPTPMLAPDVELARFTTTDDLRALLARHAAAADVVVMAAAVADFRPTGPPRAGKLERVADRAEPLRLELESTPDLLAEVASHRRSGQLLVGFALEEPDRLDERARAKLVRKGVDAIVANSLRTMDADDIDGKLIVADGRVLVPEPADHPAAGRVSKSVFARWLVDALIALHARPPAPSAAPGERQG